MGQPLIWGAMFALALAVAGGGCGGRNSDTRKGTAAIQSASGGTASTSETSALTQTGAAASGQIATAVAQPADATPASPDYSTWSTMRLENEIARLKKLAPTYDNMTPTQRAQLRAAYRALDVQRSHPVPEDRPPRSPIPGSSPKTSGGAK